MSAHQPKRPEWTCAVDGDEWPCGPVRQVLLEHYGQNLEAAAQHLLCLMGTAHENAADALDIPPAQLYRRFVGWTLPKGHVCRVCGKRGHDALPGWPPRLFPCKGLVIPPLREPGDGQSACAAMEAALCGVLPVADDEPE